MRTFLRPAVICTTLMIAAAFSAKAQATVTIGTGTGNSTSQPIYTFANYSATESIYKASEFGGQTGNITAIAYDKVSGASTQTIPNVTIYMKLVADTTTGSANRSISLSGYTQVWNGTFPNGGSGWQEVTLNTPFNFSATSQSLSVLVVNNSGTIISSGRPSFRYTTVSSTKKSANYSNDAASWNDTKTLSAVWERPNAKFTFQPSSPLPVHLIDFKATAQQGASLISWSTAKEEKDNVYMLERKAENDKQFMAIYETKAEADYITGMTYQYFDKDIHGGTILYRLRMKDGNGKEMFSKIIAVNNVAIQANDFVVYPNPVSGIVTISSSGGFNGTIVIRNINGVVVMSIDAFNSNSHAISLESLPAGMYAITCGRVTKRIIKQ